MIHEWYKWSCGVAMALLVIGGCRGSDGKEVMVASKGKIKIYELPMRYLYEDASLSLIEPTITRIDSPGIVKFRFEVRNYELRAQTPDAVELGCANSQEGQHIHFVVNNSPYLAFYTDTFSYEFKEKGAYMVVAFLSRSYHIGIKHPSAVVVREFLVGKNTPSQYDLRTPVLIYSRPKGTYRGSETKRLVLDFYLLNCTLSPDGYRVKAIIDENEFLLTKWVPYVIEGLEDGKHTFRLILLDSNGMPVSSPFADSGPRTITLCGREPC